MNYLKNFILLSILTIITTITAVGIPSGGLVSIALILNAIGISSKQIGLIYIVDWLV
jgi:Na+/H+-dicarboxylate symporter